MIYKKGQLVQCRRTGRWYDPIKELHRVMEANKDVFIRLKNR
jgi:hypothetical protein